MRIVARDFLSSLVPQSLVPKEYTEVYINYSYEL